MTTTLGLAKPGRSGRLRSPARRGSATCRMSPPCRERVSRLRIGRLVFGVFAPRGTPADVATRSTPSSTPSSLPRTVPTPARPGHAGFRRHAAGPRGMDQGRERAVGADPEGRHRSDVSRSSAGAQQVVDPAGRRFTPVPTPAGCPPAWPGGGSLAILLQETRELLRRVGGRLEADIDQGVRSRIAGSA